MYPGAHVTGGLGASECSGAVAARERRSNADAYSYAESNAHSKTDADTNSDANASTRTGLLPHLERQPGIHRRHDGESERHQLHSRLLDAEPESGDE
jgi:hypothetical protein